MMVSGWQIKNVASTSMVFAAALERLNHNATLGLLQQVISEVDQHCRAAGGQADAVAALRVELLALIAGVQERCARDQEAFVVLGQRLAQAEAALLAVQQGHPPPRPAGWRQMLPWLLVGWLGCALIGWGWCRHCGEAAQRAMAGHAAVMDRGAGAVAPSLEVRAPAAPVAAPSLEVRAPAAPVAAPVAVPAAPTAAPAAPGRAPAGGPHEAGASPRGNGEGPQPGEREPRTPKRYRDSGGGS